VGVGGAGVVKRREPVLERVVRIPSSAGGVRHLEVIHHDDMVKRGVGERVSMCVDWHLDAQLCEVGPGSHRVGVMVSVRDLLTALRKVFPELGILYDRDALS
jgi:hypothetical protein